MRTDLHDFAPWSIAPGAPVTLVRYILTRDGWTTETVTGRYGGRTREAWTVNGRELPRNQWMVCEE